MRAKKISPRCSRRRSRPGASSRGRPSKARSSRSGPRSRSSTLAARARRMIEVAELKDDEGDIEVDGRRSHPGGGRLDRGRADALAQAGARGGDARQLEDAFHAGLPVEGKVEAGGQGRLRGPHRPPARLLPVLADRHVRGHRSGAAHRAASTRSGSSSTRTAAGTSSSRGARCSKRSSGRRRPSSASRLSPGAVMTGRVASVRDFGAFVDLGAGVQGLLHVSEMGWSRVLDPSQVVKPGEEITVKVLRVDDDGQKIALGLEAAHRRSVVDCRGDLRGRPGAHRPRDAHRGVRCVRRARAGRRGPGARLDVSADGARRRLVEVGRRRDDGDVRDPEHRSREEAHRRRAGAGGIRARHRCRRVGGDGCPCRQACRTSRTPDRAGSARA